MKLELAVVTPKRTLAGFFGEVIESYLGRAGRYASASLRLVTSEVRLLEYLQNVAGRSMPMLVLTDSRGQQVSSEELAGVLGSYMDGGAQSIVVAIGPADGWSAAARARADKMIAFGRITLPHELAAVVAAEQIYRALTIRAGHPYHSGH